MTKFAVIGAVCLSAIAVGACGSSSTTTTGGSTPPVAAASPSPSPGFAATPGAAATLYWQAVIDKNCPIADDMVTGDLKTRFDAQAGGICASINSGPTLTSFTLGTVTTTATGATVNVSLTYGATSKVDALTEVQVNGSWKITGFAVVG
jgi:hypothetical protein